MLELALKAKLPLVKVSTTDTVNAIDIVSELVGRQVMFYEAVSCDAITRTVASKKYIVGRNLEDSAEKTYRHLLDLGATLLLINTDEESLVVFDAGVLPTPKSMVEDFLSRFVEEDKVAELMQVVGGMTLKDIAEVCQLTMAATGSLTARGVSTIRKQYVSKLVGISQVDLEQAFYLPPEALERWLYVNGEYFLSSDEPRLTPRGLLLQGHPGVGKTQGAKFIAWSLGVPLYRLDMSSMMVKWLGVSEASLRNALQQIDREEPCVLLIDEVEKLFQADHGTDQTASRMLSQLLWWLQEHRTRVLSVMTTNKLEAIPPELYREGRIDDVIELRGLQKKAAVDFVRCLMDSFDKKPKYSKQQMTNALGELYMTATEVSHAAITQAAYEVVKLYGK